MAKTVQCGICGNEYSRITITHLNACSPGMTLEEYRDLYGPTSPGGISKSALVQYAGPLAERVIEALSSDTTLLNDLATRVGQHLFSDSMRGKIMGTAVMLLAERTGSYQNLLQRLQLVDSELFTAERVKAGGPDGAPTDTHTLVKLAQYASARVQGAEDTLLRLLKSAIDDRKTHGVNLQVSQSFSGRHEQIIVPETLDAKQREGLRRLATRLIRSPGTVRSLIQKVKGKETDESAETTEEVECRPLDQ